MVKPSTMRLVQLLLGANGALGALTQDNFIESQESIKEAANLAAEDLMSFYEGEEEGGIRGIMSSPPPEGDYAWGSAGLFWAGMIDYRSQTGDDSYDDVILRGIQFQAGSKNDFMSANWTASMGNDDQAFWALAAVRAASSEFQDPVGEQPRWEFLAQNVFAQQSEGLRRVKSGSCEGAMRWQIFSANDGYDYVSSLANLAYFSLGAQLAHLNDNGTAATVAEDTWDILTDLKFIDDKFNVYEGASVDDCEDINKLQFSINAALALEGSAYLHDYTNDNAWKERVDGLVDRTLEVFFPDGVAVEPACEEKGCNPDVVLFKGVLHRALATTARLVPGTADKILPTLRSSAAAAGEHCTGGDNGRICSFAWTDGGKTNNATMGAQSSALGALVSVIESSERGGSGSGNGNGNGSGTGGDSGSDNGGDSEEQTDGETPESMSVKNGVSLGVVFTGLVFGAMTAF